MGHPSAELPLAHRPRDHRLDFWRGLCLVDMVLVHLVAQGLGFGPVGHEFFTNYTRFAAGGYVMLSGMTVGFVFFPRVLDPARRWEAYGRVWRRAVFIYAVHFAVTFAEMMVYAPVRNEPLPAIWPTVRDIFLFRLGYDLLPFYVFMLALSPLIMELLRRRLAWVVMSASAALFLWTHWGRHWESKSFVITNTFFFGLWQVLFIVALYAGTKLGAYDKLQRRTKLRAAGVCWMGSIVVWFLAYGYPFGIGPTPGEHPLSPLTFWKTPLTVGEVIRYLFLVGAIVTTTDLLWPRLQSSAVAAFVNRLGRRSLAMYLTQIYVVDVVDHYADKLGLPWGTQFMWMAVALALLWCMAWLLDTARDLRKRRAASQPDAVPLPS